MDHSLIDVNIAIATRQEKSFHNVRAYIVNYTASCEFPQKFYYQGCIALKSSGGFWSRASCAHERKATKPMYRFQLQLTDRTPSLLVTVTIFNEDYVLTRFSAEDFAKNSKEGQQAIIREATLKGEANDLYLKVKQDLYLGEFVCIVQSLYRIQCNHQIMSEEDELIVEVMRTLSTLPGPPMTPHIYHTPRATLPTVTSSGASGESSSS